MKKLDEIKSLNDISYTDYLNYTEIMSAKKVKLVGKKEVLCFLPIVVGLASLGLLPVSTWVLLLSIPLICVGMFFAAVSIHSVFVNFCKRADAKAKMGKFSRLKNSTELSKLASLMAEFERSDRFQLEKLVCEITSLKTEIKHLSGSAFEYDKKSIALKRQELQEKEYLLNQINKTLPANARGKKLKQLANQNLNSLNSGLN